MKCAREGLHMCFVICEFPLRLLPHRASASPAYLPLCEWNDTAVVRGTVTCPAWHKRQLHRASLEHLHSFRERPLPALKIIIISEFCLEAKGKNLSGIEIKDDDFIVLPALVLAVGICGSSRARKSCSSPPRPPHAVLNPEQSNYIFRGNHLEDNQFHCKHPGIQQLNMALVGMTSLKLCLCCCVTPSVYYNLVAETIWLSAYCVQSPVAGCCHCGMWPHSGSKCALTWAPPRGRRRVGNVFTTVEWTSG